MTQDPLTLVGSLLWSNVRVGLLLACVWLAITVFRARTGALRHDVWMTAIVGCLLLPVLSAVLPTIPLSWWPAADTGAGDFVAPLVAGTVGADPVAAVGSDLVAAGARWVDWRWVMPVAWLFGVVASIGWFAFGIASVVRSESRMRPFPDPAVGRLKDELCASTGLRRPVRLLESAVGTPPHTWGVIRPRIVLPAQSRHWPYDQLRNVLLHELGHIKRFDWLRLGLMRVAAAVYWFNPLIWLAVRECRFEAERACDDFVLQAGGESTDYAEQLIDLMTSRRQTAGFGIAFGDGGFARRVRSILASTNQERAMSRFGNGIVATAIVAAAGVLAACQVTSGQPLETQIQTQQEAERAAAIAREEAERAAVLARQEAEVAAALAREEAEVAAALQRQAAEMAVTGAGREADAAELQNLARLEALEAELMQRERMIEDLKSTLDRASAELVERERELTELQSQLEQTSAVP